ncbi:MAG: ABC transporter ATP-binding protein, partial [Acholeplasmataceae bacterium]
MKIKSLFKLTKPHLIFYLILAVLVIFHRFSYSYVPLFTQYLIKSLYLYLDPLNNNLQAVNLPEFLINFFDSAPNILTTALYVGTTLAFYQAMRYAFMYFEQYIRGRTQESIAYDLRMDLFEHIQNLSYSYHKNSDSGDLIQRVTSDVETVTGFIVLQFMQLIGLLASLFSGVFQMYFINQTIMWISLGVIPIYAISSVIYFIKIEKIFNEVEEEESKMMTVIQENVSNQKVVKAFSNEPYEIEKMTKQNIVFRDKKIKANKIVALYWGLMDFISMTQYGLVTVLAIYYVKEGVMDGPSVIAALMVLGLLIWPIRGLGRLINEFSKASVAINRINEILNQKSEYLFDGTLKPKITGEIIFDKVSFKFPDDKTYLFKNLSFKINAKNTVAIIGKTGSGKSTLANILMRMYEYEGSILIDGVELRDIKKSYIRYNIGTVLQDPFLYSKTVYENISITNKEAHKLDVINAAKIASLEKDIHTFKQGYDT